LKRISWRYIFTFIHQKAGSSNRKAEKNKRMKKNQTQKHCKEYTKCYKLARYGGNNAMRPIDIKYGDNSGMATAADRRGNHRKQ